MRAAVLILVALAPAGCDLDLDLDFHSEATSIRATGEGELTRVSICAGPSELLSCNGDERFEVTAGDETVEATAPFLSFGTLEAVFAASRDETPISVIRLRDGAGAFVDLPAPFALDGHAAGTTIELRWEPDAGGAPMFWTAAVGCGSGTSYFGDEHELDDDGVATISTAELPEADEDGVCHAAITVTRRRAGAIDGGYPDGSRIVGEQARTFGFDIRR